MSPRAAAIQGRIFVGVGGWNFAPWRGPFYPEGLPQSQELHYASRQLTSIEINSTFYRLQTPATFQKWHDQTPEAFMFSVKAPRFVTHRKELATAASSVDRFLGSGVLRLALKLGAINWQLPPEKPFDAEEVGRFLELLPASIDGRALRHAIEARHPSFDHEEFFALTRKRGVAVIEAGDSQYPHLVARTAPFSYLRLMGTKPSQPQGYAAAALEHWRQYAQTLARDGDVFLYFISGAKQRNPLAAQAMLES
jgi:uncharacterized protein YecE (DUF72 family)